MFFENKTFMTDYGYRVDDSVKVVVVAVVIVEFIVDLDEYVGISSDDCGGDCDNGCYND